MNWNILILSLCVLLLVLCLWKEITRRNKRSLIARVAATFFTVAALSLIVLPVTVTRRLNNVDSSTAVLLTEGFEKDSVKNFVRLNPGIKLFTVDKNIKFADAGFIADVNLLARRNISTLHLFGHGLPAHELKRITKTNVVFHPARVDNLFTTVDWQQNITSGDRLLIQGKFNNVSGRAVKVILSGFNTNLDSAILSPTKTSDFDLITFPKHVGKAAYALTVLSAGDTLESNPIPVNVEPASSIDILLLAGSPDFDNKFLKNWLTENEYGFVARTYISRNKYERQFVNISTLSIGRLTSSLLDKFDVVIADLAELNAMPSSDLSNLRSAIENRGLGLIVKATVGARSTGFYLASFPLVGAQDSIQHTIKLNAPGFTIPSSLKVQQPVFISNRPGTEPILTDQHRRTLVSSKLIGQGKVVATTIPNSYAWWLAGNKQDYAAYWTLLLNKATKKIVTDYAWEISPIFPQKDLEMQLSLKSVRDSTPIMQVSSEVIYPFQNPYIPYAWSGRYWPARAGWHAMQNIDGTASWIYVYATNDWKGIAAAEKIRVTKNFAGIVNNINKSNITIDVPVEIPRIYFMILFIICAAFLWFEKKYRNG